MIELVERIFMNKNLLINKATTIMATAILIIFMLIMGQYTIISLAIVPVALAIFLSREKVLDSLILFLVLGLLSFVFSFTKKTYAIFLALIILGLAISFVVKLDLKDMNALIIIFIISAVFLNLGYLYLLKINAIDLGKFVDELIKMLESEGINYPRELLETSLKTIPAILSVIAFIYSLLALKTTRNYLNYKDSSIRDFNKINSLQITIREVAFGLLLALIFILGAQKFGLDESLIQTNAISLGISLVQINGLFTLDYVIERKRSRAYRIFTWILIVFLFRFLSIFFLLLGGIDIMFNLRGALHAREK